MVNEILLLIADICGVIGMGCFLLAEMKQLIKIIKKQKITGISHMAYISKLAAIGFTSVMLGITGLYLSLVVLIVEGIVVAAVLYLMKKYKKVKEAAKAKKYIEDNGWSAVF